MWDAAHLPALPWVQDGRRTCLQSEHLSRHIKLALTLWWPQTRHDSVGWSRRGLSSRPVVCVRTGGNPRNPLPSRFHRANRSSAGMCFVSRLM
ncbi:unnamed protein product [Tetraodon nigroviridis]|uniref:(spotted green pufferfish) hypothetical protein n=1 Tax=Tetraodon nigroviridis TaxID=99883 RepID=Q4RSI3_TETNG|nr:unnamed protein product [Tetraodon nigroviridis]